MRASPFLSVPLAHLCPPSCPTRRSSDLMRAISGRAESLERAARSERRARQAAQEKAQRRARQAARARIVEDGAARALAAIETSLARAGAEREALEEARPGRDAEIAGVRTELERLGKEHAELTDVVHKDEVARAAQMAKIEQLQQKSVDDLGLDPEVLVEEYGPHLLIPVASGEDVEEVPFV